MKKYTETILAKVTPEVKDVITMLCDEDDRTESNFIRKIVNEFLARKQN